MKQLLDEFKAFINKGNLIDLAVAVVLASFFGPIITALVDGVIMNIIAAIFGKPNFDDIVIEVGKADLLVGTVLTAVVQFLVVAFVLFLIVKVYNKWRKAEEEAAGPTEVDLLTEIRDSLQNR